jgi:hypothetical protein
VSKGVVFETDNVYVHDLSFESSIMSDRDFSLSPLTKNQFCNSFPAALACYEQQEHTPSTSH